MRGFRRSPLADSRPATTSELVEDLKRALPVMVARSHLKRYGWPYTEGYMANIDSARNTVGPKRIRCGAKVVYLRDGDDGLIAWLVSRSS
jgi:hypothetical protein